MVCPAGEGHEGRAHRPLPGPRGSAPYPPAHSARCAPIVQARGPGSRLTSDSHSVLHSLSRHLLGACCVPDTQHSECNWQKRPRSHPLQPAFCLPATVPPSAPRALSLFPVSHLSTCATPGVFLTFILHHISPLHDSISWPSPAPRRKLQQLGVSSGALYCQLQPCFLVCSHSLLTCVLPHPHPQDPAQTSLPLWISTPGSLPSGSFLKPSLPPRDSPCRMMHRSRSSGRGKLQGMEGSVQFILGSLDPWMWCSVGHATGFWCAPPGPSTFWLCG